MALIIRIDIDRSYGKKHLYNKVLSRLSSDFYFPKIVKYGYLKDTKEILILLNKLNCQSHIFFRRCSLPNKSLLNFINDSGHKIGLHLENSKTFLNYKNELNNIQNNTNVKVKIFSKHGSGKYKYGIYYYAPYEPNKYIEWGMRTGMKVFFGNLEDPSLLGYKENNLLIFPSAFWLESYWRDANKYSIDWFIENACQNDIVLLIHPDIVIVDPILKGQFIEIIKNVPTKVLV